jgi:hypothetical protein
MIAHSFIEFPAIRYFPVNPRAETKLSMLVLKDSARLHNFARWPRRNRIIPGGVLDSSGFDIPIIDLVDWPEIPWWFRPIDAVFDSLVILGSYRVDFKFGERKKLKLDEFKERLCTLLAQQREFYTGSSAGYRARQRRVREAESYAAAIRGVREA